MNKNKAQTQEKIQIWEKFDNYFYKLNMAKKQKRITEKEAEIFEKYLTKKLQKEIK